jgi:hypothetical protein
MAMVGHGPGAVFLCNTADLIHHPITGVELKTLLQETLAKMAANDPVRGGLLIRTKYCDAVKKSSFPSHANTLRKCGNGEGRSITPPFSWHCASAGSGRAGGGCRCAGSDRCR